MVRDAQPAEQRAEQQIAIAPFLAPHERPMEEQRHEEQVEAVHLGEGRLLPDRPGEGQGERGREGDDRADSEANGDQDHDPDRRGGGHGREQVRAIRHRLDRDEAEQRPDQAVQRIAGRVEDPESGGDHLGLGPVAEADAGQQGPDVHDECHGERADRGEVRGAHPFADALDRARAGVHRRRGVHRSVALLGIKPREASTLSPAEPSGYDARRRWLLDPAITVSARDVEHPVNQATPRARDRGTGDVGRLAQLVRALA